jgi:hypothetical protein
MMEFKVDYLDEDIIESIIPLIEENHAVTGQFEELDMNWDGYLQLADDILVIRLMEDEVCVGVLIFLIGFYPHNQKQLFADQLTFFIQAEYRMQAIKMLQLSETFLKSRECEFVVQSARYGSKFCKTLEKIGYEPLDVKYSKRL